MVSERVAISLKVGGTIDLEPVDRSDVWAVTPAIEIDSNAIVPGYYMVTHVPSGLCVNSFRVSLRDAFDLFHRLNRAFPSYGPRAPFGVQPEDRARIRPLYNDWVADVCDREDDDD